MPLHKIKQRIILAGATHLHIAEQGTGPLVLLLHGFPESWYSWRHQFEPLAKAGYRAVAPDMRGYGLSDKPADIEDYNQVEVTNDIINLIAALGYDQAIVIGHDWGAPTAWNCALLYPEQVIAVGALSVPFSPRSTRPPMAAMREVYKDRFFYQLYFQTPDVAEAAFEEDVALSLRKFFYMASADVDISLLVEKDADADLLSDLPDFPQLPAWLTQADMKFYTDQFEWSGFRGPLNYYRNFDLTWELTEGVSTVIDQPALFLAGEKDPVIAMMAEDYKYLPERVNDLRVNQLIPNVGHWTQQEAPDAVNAALLEFLDDIKKTQPQNSSSSRSTIK